MNIKDKFAERLNLALDMIGVTKDSIKRPGEVAKMFGVTRPAAIYWLTGQKLPGVEKLLVIGKTLKVSIDWLVGNEPGSSSLPASKLMLEHPVSAVLNLHRGNIELIPSASANWEPDIGRDDMMIVDKAIDTVEDGEIYVVLAGTRQIIRKIHIGIDGKIYVYSKNKATDADGVPIEQEMVRFVGAGQEACQECLNILGKVVLSIKKM